MKEFKDLKKWLSMQNDKLKMFNKPSRGIYSTADIKNGQIILEIPSKYIIHYDDIKDIKISDRLRNQNSDFARFLFLENNIKQSFYKPYLDSLPKNIDEYIFFYDAEKLNQLKETSLFCKDTYNFETHQKNIIHDAKILHTYLKKKRLIPDEYINYDDFYKIFLKYRILVCSRVFGYEKRNLDEVGLVPYADLFNHSNDSNTQWYFSDIKNAFILEATKNIKKGNEIYDSYGNKTNMELLMYYGFTIPNNKNSIVNMHHEKDVYEFNYDTKVKQNEKMIDKLKIKVKELSNKLKSESIKDENIKNIYNDEIKIIKKVLKNK